MAGDIENLRVWTGADLYKAPFGTTAPTTLTEDWPVDWDPFGYVTVDGFTISKTSEKKDIYLYGGALGRSLATKFKPTFKFVPAEQNDAVWEVQNPGGETVTAGGEITRYSAVPTQYTEYWALGLELTDGDEVRRLILPRVKFDPDGDESIKDDDLDAPEMVANIFPVELTVNGNTKQFWKYEIDGVAGS
jgi:hypothetical protein